MDNPSAFGPSLRRVRIAAGLTQEMLAERSTIAVRSISDLERGLSQAPRAHTLAMLMDALDLNSDMRAELMAAAHGSLASPARIPRLLPIARAPLQLTTFIGRESETSTLAMLLTRANTRLITLTGPGGVGKTRLANHLAEYAATDFPDGVAFIDLTQLTEADALWPAIGRCFGVDESHPGIRHISIELLGQQTILLVLDNFEHILEAALHVSDLLQACANLKALVTSRSALQLSGEQVFEVLPLPTPDAAAGQSVERLSGYDSIRLFVDRARLIRPDFALTEGNAGPIASICRRLDGLPLALELASAQVRTMPPRTLLQQLQASTDAPSLRLLKTGPRDAPVRQQTLRSTITWSHDLLTDEQQALFRRLAVFVGGCTREAAERICSSSNADDDVMPGEIGGSTDEVLNVLVDKSLLGLSEGPDGQLRFLMLETIGEFAREQLALSGEEASIKQRHAQFYLSMVESTGALLFAQKQQRSMASAEQGNVAAALQWLVQQG